MKRLWLVFVCCLATVGTAAAQYPAAGFPQGYQPGYGGPSMMPQGMPPGYGGGNMMPPQGYTDGQKPMAANTQAETKKSAFGWHPAFRKLFGTSTCKNCDNEGNGEGHAKKPPGVFTKSKVIPPPLPPVQGGTLVFPHHPYVRSPRDWFMED